MNRKTKNRLEELNADFKQVYGSEFNHFYCPILYLDRETRLCQAHIINRALLDSDDTWTVQRADVDSFYGSHFEADFVLLGEKGRRSPDEVLINKPLAKKLKPRFYVNSEPVEHYYPSGDVPVNHSLIRVFSPEESEILAIKKTPEEMDTILNHQWEIRIEHNLNLVALVSLIKAAHLTLFKLLGYRHPLSAGGHFVGKTILGDFFLKCLGMKKEEVLRQAKSHFSEFANMVRPVNTSSLPYKGTISDHFLYFWMYMNKPWALLIFVNIANQLHAIALPVLQDDDGASRFHEFLGKDEFITEARLAQWKGDSWEISSKWEIQKWPKSNYNPES